MSMSRSMNSSQWVPPSSSGVGATSWSNSNYVPAAAPINWTPPISSVPSTHVPSSQPWKPSSTSWNPTPVPSTPSSQPWSSNSSTSWNPPLVPSTSWNPPVPPTLSAQLWSSNSSTSWNPASVQQQWAPQTPQVQTNRFVLEEESQVPITPPQYYMPVTPIQQGIPNTPDVIRLRQHALHPMLCMEHMGTPGVGEVRGVVTEVNTKTNNFFLKTLEGKDYTIVYDKFLPVRVGDYLHGLAKLIAPFNLELVAHPSVFTARSGQDIENLIKQRFGKYGFPTVTFMRRLNEIAEKQNLVDYGVDYEIHQLKTPAEVLDYMAQQHNDGNSQVHLFDGQIDAKKLKMIFEFWNDSIILRRLYLLGFNRRQIRDLHMKPAQLYSSIIFNPYTIPGLTMTRCYELDLCTGRMAKMEEARAGEILRAVHANTYKKGWNATTETWLLKRYPDLLQYSEMLQKYYRLVTEEITHYTDTYVDCSEEVQNPELGFFKYNIDEASETFSITDAYPSKREKLTKVKVWYLKKQYMAEKMISMFLQSRLMPGPTLNPLSLDELEESSILKGKGKSRDSSSMPIIEPANKSKEEKLMETQQRERSRSAADFRKQTITTKGPIYSVDIDMSQINPSLDENQRQAVTIALKGGVSILTGGPGCGKTFCIREICRLLSLNNIPYMLTSFVGKAVSRIREVVCQGVGKNTKPLQPSGIGSEADPNETKEEVIEEEKKEENKVWMSDVNPATLHSLIGRTEKPFFRVLIIDESSMLEIGLLYDFMCTYGTNYGIIFVGDANQLPPIGPGSLFNEMIKSRAIPKTVLSIFHRLDDGTDSDSLLYNMRSIVRWKEHTPYLFAQGDNFQILDGEAEQVYPLLLALSQTYNKDDICVICPYTKYSENLNQICQLFWNSENRHIVEPNGKTWYIGDNVLFLTNSKELSVYNGEKGTILDSDPPGLCSHGEESTQGLKGIKIDFGQGRVHVIPIMAEVKKQIKYGQDKVGTTYVDEEGNTKVHTSEDLPNDDDSDRITTKDIDLAYCLTVHKSQGSEYPIVIFIMPMFANAEHKTFINRNMIYTGISRARQMVIHLGNIMTTTISIGNKLPYRSEYLSDRLLKVLPRIYAVEKIQELTKYDEDPSESFDPDDDMWG